MKKIIFIAFILVQSIVLSQSQSELNIYESPEYEDEIKTDSIQSIYTSNQGKSGIVRLNKKFLFFDIFDSNLKRVYTNSFKIKKREKYVGDIFFNDEIKVFTETYPEKYVKVLWCYILNIKNNTSKKIQLTSTKIDKKINLFSNKKGIHLAVSPNLNHFSIVKYTINKGTIYFNIDVFNSESFNLEYSKKATRDENSFYSITDLKVDNKKSVYVLGESFYNEKSPKMKIGSVHYFILEKFSLNNYSKLKIDFENKYIKTLKATEFNGQLNLYGLYSEKNLNHIKGVCNVSIDINSMEILNQNLQEFPYQIYNDLFNNDIAKKKKKKSKEFSNYKIDYVLKDSKNNVYLLAEELYYTSSGQSYNPSGVFMYGSKTPHYDDIIIIKFNESGKLDWGRSIFKKDTEPSYNAFLKNDKLNVILNSGKDLKELKDGRIKVSQGYFETSALYNFVYSNNGVVSIQKIQDNKGKTYYLPHYGNFVNGKFIMISDSRKKRRFMQIR